MMNIILCGLSRCGKTTIGNMLAKKLSWNFIDTDCLIERAYTETCGKTYSCREIFFSVGERQFRVLENKQIASLKDTAKTVIALGGGSLDHSDNTKILKSTGHLFYLRVPSNILWKRIQQTGIPAYLNSAEPECAFYQLAKNRVPVYEAAAHYIIDTPDLCEKEIVNAILINRKILDVE